MVEEDEVCSAELDMTEGVEGKKRWGRGRRGEGKDG